ncbi:ribonuclease III [Patescibacteria group bacterium]|nr:ribonuclease III [Patescibacteria group bacterium]
MDKDFNELEKKLNIKFNDIELLRQAFVHRSYLNEHPTFELPHNERLEFLGDAVLELVVTENLYLNFPNPEGDLTNWRASLVNSKILSKIAEDIGMDDYLFLSKGESKDTGKARQYILANAIEALIGAIYLDSGWESAKSFINQFILCELEHILENKLYIDPKSSFQEAAQEKEGATPTYKVIKEFGPDHAKSFVVGVYLKNKLVAEGEGSSKQEAQEDAARKGLESHDWES